MLLKIVALLAVAGVLPTEGAAKGDKIFKRNVASPSFIVNPAMQFYQTQQKQFNPQQFNPQQPGFWQFVPFQQMETQQPDNRQPAHQQPADQQPAQKQPANLQPADLQPAQQQPIVDKAAPQNPFAGMVVADNLKVVVHKPVEEKPLQKIIHEKLIAKKPAPNKSSVAKKPLRQIDSFIRYRPANSELLRVQAISALEVIPILDRLPANATRLRPDIDDSFSCEGKKNRYYADVANECQVFHRCVPLKEVFAADEDVALVPDITYHYSFICNEFTLFDQANQVCAWAKEALPCAEVDRYVAALDSTISKVGGRTTYGS